MAWTDSFGDGTRIFCALLILPIAAAFRRWFTQIAEYQAMRPQAELPAEIQDCASLLRFAYREALKRHDDTWFQTTGVEVSASPAKFMRGTILTRRWDRLSSG